MLKRDYRKTGNKAYELPKLAVGDVLLVGKFKNRKATITGFSSDENNQPVAQTDKGEQYCPLIPIVIQSAEAVVGKLVLRTGHSPVLS